MSFPWHDPPWCEVGDLLAEVAGPHDRVLAPDEFWWRLPTVWRYVPANLTPPATFDWVVVHKGEMESVPRRFLEAVAASMTIVLANEVFVVFARVPGDRRVDPSSPHVVPFIIALAQLPPSPADEPAAVHDRVLGHSSTLRQFGSMTSREARDAQDEFFRSGGYRYPTLRDKMYYSELRHHRDLALADVAGGTVLELCGGAFPVGSLPPGSRVVRSDFSPVGVEQAVALDAGVAGVTHLVCDADAVAIADGRCDLVLLIDSIEHLLVAERAVGEAARVLKDGGEFLVTYVNRNSVNQVLTRTLGYPTFLTNHQHVREFTLDEIRSMLADVGFSIESTAGVELRPYWGVPGIDHLVRDTIDDDEEFVEMLRVLGRAAGIDYAYIGVVRARKTRPLSRR